MLELVIDNGSKHLNNMTSKELEVVMKLAASLSFTERAALYEQIVKPSEPAFHGDITNPAWLQSKYPDNIWHCKFGRAKKTIDFNIHLDDGQLLTNSKHESLLDTVKYWLCVQSHPRYCGGNYPKPATIIQKIIRCLHLFDVILLNPNFRVAEHGLRIMTRDDAASLVGRIHLGVADGFYQAASLISDILKTESVNVITADINDAQRRYPSITHIPEEMTLSLTQGELIKSRVWLLSQGAYNKPGVKSSHGNASASFFANRFYTDTLHGRDANLKSYPELRIAPEEKRSEFRAVPIDTRADDGVSRQHISLYLATLKTLSIVSGDRFAAPGAEIFNDLNQQTVSNQLAIKEAGRFRTLPAQTVFSAVRQAFDFCFDYMDDILKAVSESVIDIQSVGSNTYSGSSSEPLHHIMDGLVRQNVSTNLKKYGVCRWKIICQTKRNKLPDDYFIQFRNNVGLLDLYYVLMGSILIIIGFLMARRAGEVKDLKENCLIPNTNPWLKENEETEYSLVFDNRKSGDNEEREQLSRPIPTVGAKFIWKLRHFRETLVAANLLDDTANLLLACNWNSNDFKSINQAAYAKYLDAFCDYFETPVIQLAGGDWRRYYIRLHQLRRFFAMAFFWGSGFDGLDTLRYFLGHTDAEHLYHYITENTPGVVLRGAKAEALVHQLNTDKVTNIEKLRELLMQRFDVNDVALDAIAEALEDLDAEVADGYLQTEPPLCNLRNQVEQDIDLLLADGTIDLEPTFCSVRYEDGGFIQKIQLVLIIKEVDGDTHQ